MGLVWFGTFKEKIGGGVKNSKPPAWKAQQTFCFGIFFRKKMVCRKPPYSAQKSMLQLLLSLQLQHSSWPIVVALKAAAKDNPKSVIFFFPEGFKALRFSLHRVRCHHCYLTSLAVAPSSLNHFGRCCADTLVHLHCPACQPLSSSITAGAYLQSW